MDEEQKQDFAARLQRIQSRQLDESSSPLDMTPEDIEGFDTTPRPAGDDVEEPRLVYGPVRVTMILVTLLALLGYGAFYLSSTLQATEVIAEGDDGVVESVPIVAEPDATPPILTFDVPRTESVMPGTRTPEMRGWVHNIGSVATPDGAQVQVADVADGFDIETSDRLPSKVIQFKPNSACTFRRPRAGEAVRNVRFETSNLETDVHAFSDAAIADAVLTHTQAALFKPQSFEAGKTASGRLNRVDVFVTDTSAPIYLVLQTLSGNTLWNVHRGPGVRIGHIAIIGQTSGVIPPTGVTFEALRISDHVQNFEFGSNDEVQPCMIAPYRLPKAHWEAQQRALKNNTLYENQMYTFNAGHRAFADWYTKTFGVDPETGLTEAEAAGHALVGPVPTGVLGYRKLIGRTAYVTETDNVLIGDDAVADAHRALLLAASGGSISSLTLAQQGLNQ